MGKEGGVVSVRDGEGNAGYEGSRRCEGGWGQQRDDRACQLNKRGGGL